MLQEIILKTYESAESTANCIQSLLTGFTENLCLCLQNLAFCSQELLRIFISKGTSEIRPLQPFWKFLRFWCHYLLWGHMINWFCQFAVLTQKTPPKTKNPEQQTTNPKTLAPSANQELGKYHGQLTETFPMVQVGSCIFKIKHKHIPQPRAACTTAINISSFFTQIFPFKTIWQLWNYL